MSVTSKIKNKGHMKSQLKKASGGATKNRRLEAEGSAERAVGALKQAAERVKDSVRAVRH
jgi:uncharacterized protein YjbJ (UPF0337 family)